jgi:hypothetical protein
VSRVPPHASGGPDLPRADELEQLEELGDDAIIAQQQGAHVPKPRVQVTEEARSIVISEHPGPASRPPSAPKIPGDSSSKKRSDRTEKTVVIRDRRQIEELRREMAKRRPAPPPGASKGILLWVIVGVAAFLTGGLVALFATREDSGAAVAPAPTVSASPPPSAAPAAPTEPPSVSIDELPIEGGKKK